MGSRKTASFLLIWYVRSYLVLLEAPAVAKRRIDIISRRIEDLLCKIPNPTCGPSILFNLSSQASKRAYRVFRDLQITGWIDKGLNEQAYIIPGLGDFGERRCG